MCMSEWMHSIFDCACLIRFSLVSELITLTFFIRGQETLNPMENHVVNPQKVIGQAEAQTS